jgi:hypothetical protein
MLTLAQSADLCQDRLLKGVMKAIMFHSPLLRRLPFDDILGNADAWNVEDPSNPPAVGFYKTGGVWSQDEGETIPFTTSLTTLGGDVDVPRLIQKTRSKPTDQAAARIEMKSRNMARTFEKTAIYGDDTSGTEFPGLHKWLAHSSGIFATQLLHAGSSTTGAALTAALLDNALDLVEGADLIICSPAVRRRMTTYLRTSGSYNTDRDEFGKMITVWGDGVPIAACTGCLQTETISGSSYALPVGGATSSLFVVKFGVEGLHGIQNGGIWKYKFDMLELKDALRYRLGWYVGLALRSPLAIARIDGITDVAMTA